MQLFLLLWTRTFHSAGGFQGSQFNSLTEVYQTDPVHQ